MKVRAIAKYKVFISYHHGGDEEYKNRLVQALGSKFIDRSVSHGDIHDYGLPVGEIRRRISRLRKNGIGEVG